MKDKVAILITYVIGGMLVLSGMRFMEHVWPRESVVKIVHYICVVRQGAEPDCRALTKEEEQAL